MREVPPEGSLVATCAYDRLSSVSMDRAGIRILREA
jgi:hypothetical protein